MVRERRTEMNGQKTFQTSTHRSEHSLPAGFLRRFLLLMPLLLGTVALFALLSGRLGRSAPVPVSMNLIPDQRVELVSMSARPAGTTRSLVKVLQAPREGSRVIDILTPGQQVTLVGRSGAYYALSAHDGQVRGWAPLGEISVETVSGTPRAMTLVYQSPDVHSTVVDMIFPGEPVGILGSTPDGEYYALAGTDVSEPVSGYVAAGDLQMESSRGRSRSVGRVYRRADAASPVVTVITPDHSFDLLGRDAGGEWIAVSGSGDEKFTGWMPAGEVVSQVNRLILPVIPMR